MVAMTAQTIKTRRKVYPFSTQVVEFVSYWLFHGFLSYP